MNSKNSSKEVAVWIAQLLDKKGGKQIAVIDVRESSSITDFMVIATGTSLKHLETLVNAPCEALKKSGFPADGMDGLGTHWIVADFSDVIVHVFDEVTRGQYDLESLWSASPRLEWEAKAGLQLRSIAL